MGMYQAVLALAARFLLSALMFYAALFNILNWSHQVSLLDEDQVPMPGFMIFAATAIEIVLGVPLLLGYKTRGVAFVLAAYVLLCAILLHPFWAVPPGSRTSEELHFFETLGAMGGLLMLAAYGPGGISIDARKRAAKVSA